MTAAETLNTSKPSSDPLPRWESYVAIGDSFSEGLWDIAPQNPDICRGWADLLALTMSTRRIAAGETPMSYANLAIRGRLIGPIIDEQLPEALSMKPQLISIIGGGNDILRPAVDVDRIAARLDKAVVRARATGADVLLATGGDFGGRGSLAFTRSRTAVFNSHIWSIAQRRGAYVMDMWGNRTISDPRFWAEDRIHLTTQGHQRVADMALVGLGLRPENPRFAEPLGPRVPVQPRDRARENILWAREHVGPWIKRRLTGTSTGDQRVAKYPTLETIE
ncbi:SGNH/GDSL hydrolase family protein [Jonesia quinghaiensis]|uniref:SGNH/GDSL hydrolase family protein n=1 Tax=Jonesia quinghaiensis TaxID=262806 RepID=UPI00040EF0A2|nr:SGNH/GDSL hydrolase family protein [Jonesia quinghaiensis]